MPLRYGHSFINRSQTRSQETQVNTIDHRTRTVDLAPAAWSKKARVSCLSSRSGRIWGKLDDDAACILQLKVQLDEAPDHKLSDFEMNMIFPATSHDFSSACVATATGHSPHAVEILEAYPTQLRGPVDTKEKTRELNMNPKVQTPAGAGAEIGEADLSSAWREGYSWIFAAKVLSDERGYLSGTRFRWMSNPLNRQPEAVGLLRCSVVLIHDGRQFDLQCHVEGRTGKQRSGRDFLGVLRTKPSEPPIWRLTPQPLTTDLKGLIEKLQEEDEKRNGNATADG